MATFRGVAESRRNYNGADVALAGKVLQNICSRPPGEQLLFGIGSGAISGVAICKLGKFMCIALGASVIILQLGAQKDYVNFTLMGTQEISEDDSLERRRQFMLARRQLQPNFRTWWQNVRSFSLKYPNIASGFVGGFLIGLGCV